MNKHLNTLKFQNSNDQSSEIKWFVDEDNVVWYDSVDILFNLGFTKQGFTIKEEIGKIYLERNEPKKLRAGRIHWNKESISVLKEIIDDKAKSDFWDNIEIIFNLVNHEIGKHKEGFEDLLKVNCHIVGNLTTPQIQFLLDNGWVKSKSAQSIPLYGKVFIIYNRGETKLSECKEYLKQVTDFDNKLEKIHRKVDEEIGCNGHIKTSVISEKFSNLEWYFVYKYLKDNNFVENKEVGNWVSYDRQKITLPEYAGFITYKGSTYFSLKAFNFHYESELKGTTRIYKRFTAGLKCQGFKRVQEYGLALFEVPLVFCSSSILEVYKELTVSLGKEIIKLKEEDTIFNYTDHNNNYKYLRNNEGAVVYQYKGVTYVRINKLSDKIKHLVTSHLEALEFKECISRDNVVIDFKLRIKGLGLYKQYSSKNDCSKTEIDNFINNLMDQNLINEEVSCKEEKEVVEFLPVPTKTVRYKELVSSKGWWIFKKEVWETKEADVYEDEVDSFVSSLRNTCEIIEIK